MAHSKPKFRRRAEARPDEVLDAALALFIERGYESTRVDDIAKRAGISKGAVYLYFQSKQAVLEGLIQRAVTPIASSVLGLTSGFSGDPRPLVAKVMRVVGQRLADPAVFAIPKVVMREAIVVPEIADMYREAVLDRVMPTMIKLIRQGIDDGYLRPVDPELTVRSIVGPVLLHLLLSEIFRVRPDDGLALDRLIENHLDILFNGLSAGAPT